MNLSNPLFILFICAGLLAAIYGTTILQKAQGLTKGLSKKSVPTNIDIARLSSIVAIIMIANLVLYFLIYYVGIYSTTGEFPTLAFHGPIFAFLLVINIGFGASYHLGWWSTRQKDKEMPCCPAHGLITTRGCIKCEALVADGLTKFND